MSTNQNLKTPAWAKERIPGNILSHLKLIKLQDYSKACYISFAFFAVRSGVEIQVYKKAYTHTSDKVITLGLLPGTVICVNDKGYKSRANQAIVRNMNGSSSLFSGYSNSFKYSQGKSLQPNGFDMAPSSECTKGIHFFFSKTHAQRY